MTVAKDGVVITPIGNCIRCSNGEVYTLIGTTLEISGEIVSQHVKNIQEAVGIVIGFHGGRQF